MGPADPAYGLGPLNVPATHAGNSIRVCRLAELLADSGSCCSEATVAELPTVPEMLLVTVIVAVPVASTPSVPRLQATTPAPIEQVPCEATAFVAVSPPGSVVVITTPVAGCGPSLCAVSS
jgi:hypothetical protein